MAELAIVTVVLNGEGVLARAMDSVLGQRDVDIEYHVIDGGSTDGTLDLIRQRERALASWVSEPDGGIANAFNKGISRCSAPIIGLINADDILLPGAGVAVANAHARSPESIICGNCIYRSPLNGIGMRYRPVPSRLPSEMSVHHPSVFVPNAAYRMHGGFDQGFRLAMDYELMLRFLRRGCGFEVIDRDLSEMSLGGVSVVDWRGAYAEAARAKVMHGCPPWRAACYRRYMIARRVVRESLETIGLASVARAYRRRASVVPKEEVD